MHGGWRRALQRCPSFGVVVGHQVPKVKVLIHLGKMLSLVVGRAWNEYSRPDCILGGYIQDLKKTVGAFIGTAFDPIAWTNHRYQVVCLGYVRTHSFACARP